jgi:hypothetical protein
MQKHGKTTRAGFMGPIPDTKLTFFPYQGPPIGGEILISLNEKELPGVMKQESYFVDWTYQEGPVIGPAHACEHFLASPLVGR